MGRLGATDTEEEDGAPQTGQAGDQAGLWKARIQKLSSNSMAAEEANDEALALVALRPKQHGRGFLAELPPGAKSLLRANGGRYNPVKVSVEEMERTWWLRSQAVLETEVSSTELHQQVHCKGTRMNAANIDGITLDFEVLSRAKHGKRSDDGLLTVVLVNRIPHPPKCLTATGCLKPHSRSHRLLHWMESWQICLIDARPKWGIRDDVSAEIREDSS